MTDSKTYTPPRVWQWEQETESRFANINRPIAGATHEKALPVGEHPLQLYSLATPNGVKVTILLEELLAIGKTTAEYDAWLINIADMAVYSWYGQLVLTGLYESKEFLQVDSYTHLLRWASEVHNRPAVKRGRKINRASKSGLMERHAASDFDHLESR